MWCAGYGETHGVPKILSDFQSYCDYLDIKASQVKPTNEHINSFLDMVTGNRQPSDGEDSGKSFGCVKLRAFAVNAVQHSLAAAVCSLLAVSWAARHHGSA